jgi:hypothetical protein
MSSNTTAAAEMLHSIIEESLQYPKFPNPPANTPTTSSSDPFPLDDFRAIMNNSLEKKLEMDILYATVEGLSRMTVAIKKVTQIAAAAASTISATGMIYARRLPKDEQPPILDHFNSINRSLVNISRTNIPLRLQHILVSIAERICELQPIEEANKENQQHQIIRAILESAHLLPQITTFANNNNITVRPPTPQPIRPHTPHAPTIAVMTSPTIRMIPPPLQRNDAIIIDDRSPSHHSSELTDIEEDDETQEIPQPTLQDEAEHLQRYLELFGVPANPEPLLPPDNFRTLLPKGELNTQYWKHIWGHIVKHHFIDILTYKGAGIKVFRAGPDNCPLFVTLRHSDGMPIAGPTKRRTVNAAFK